MGKRERGGEGVQMYNFAKDTCSLDVSPSQFLRTVRALTCQRSVGFGEDGGVAFPISSNLVPISRCLQVFCFSELRSAVCKPCRFVDGRRCGFGKERGVLHFIQISRIEGVRANLPPPPSPTSTRP